MLARRAVLKPHSVSLLPDIPILELTPPHPAKNNSPHFKCLREPILQPLCFQIHPGMGGVPPSSWSMLGPQPWRVADSDPARTPAPCSKSHGIISFADPHPLTLLARLQNRVGGLGTSSHPVVPLTHLKSALSESLPFHTRISHPKPFRITTLESVHSKQLKVPLESTLFRNRGGGGRLSLTRSVNQNTNKGFLSCATPTVRGADQAWPSTVGRPVLNRTDAAALPHIYRRCAILPSLRSGDRPFLPPWRLS
jgi:hypothetical protein